jgi:hypothetical protein
LKETDEEDDNGDKCDAEDEEGSMAQHAIPIPITQRSY